MNWYNKIAGIEDFYSGTLKQKISEFPQNEADLTEEQKSYLRGLSTYNMYIIDHTELFRRYPNIIFYSFYNLSKYIEYMFEDNSWNDNIAQLVGFLKPKKLGGYACGDLPDKFFQLIMEDPEGWGLDEKYASSAFKEHEKTKNLKRTYPEFFISWLIKRFPDLYKSNDKSIEGQWDVIREFLSFNSVHNYNKLDVLSSSLYPPYESSFEEKVAFRKKRDDLVSRVYVLILNHESKIEYISKIIERKKSNSYILSGKGEEFVEILNIIIQNYNSGMEFFDEDSPFSLFFDIPSDVIGKIPLLFYMDYRIEIDSINRMILICKNKPKEYFRIELSKENNSSEDSKISLVEESEEEVSTNVGTYVSLHRIYESYKETGPIMAIYHNMNPRSDIRRELYLKWFNENLQKAKLERREEEFILEVIGRQTFAEILEEASDTLGALYISNAQMLSEEEYDPDASYAYNVRLPFSLNLANEIMDQIPMYLRMKIPEKTHPTWYYLCSGKMPCQFIYEKAIKYPSDTLKIVEHIACSGSGAEVIKEKVRERALKSKQEAKETFKNKIIEFISDPKNCIMSKVEDFQDLYSYVLNVIDRHMNDEKNQWSSSKQKYLSLKDFVLDKIDSLIIYIINEKNLLVFFGEETLRLSGFSPQESNGIFCPRYSFSDDHDSIIVFSGKNRDRVYIKMIVDDILGLKPDPANENKISTISEEGTLWHEVAHAMFSSLISREEIKNVSDWIMSPNEIIAIQYGNLQHIKKRLHDFFENNIPTSPKIEAGLLSHIEGEIVETFAWEFQGMPKEKALEEVRKNIDDFQEQVLSARSSLSKEEIVDLLTGIFLEFFMGKMMRGKAEDEIEEMSKLLGAKEQRIVFEDEEIVVPETYEYRSPGQKDEIIIRLENRPDYIKFISDVKKQIAEYKSRKNFYSYKEDLKRYFHKQDPEIFKEPREFSDLIALIFDPPFSITQVDTSKPNRLLGHLVPPSLKNEVINIIDSKKRVMETPIVEKERIVSPEEAEETGEFMTEMDLEYGPDWVWTAKNNGWYKKAIRDLSKN